MGRSAGPEDPALFHGPGHVKSGARRTPIPAHYSVCLAVARPINATLFDFPLRRQFPQSSKKWLLRQMSRGRVHFRRTSNMVVLKGEDSTCGANIAGQREYVVGTRPEILYQIR